MRFPRLRVTGLWPRGALIESGPLHLEQRAAGTGGKLRQAPPSERPLCHSIPKGSWRLVPDLSEPSRSSSVRGIVEETKLPSARHGPPCDLPHSPRHLIGSASLNVERDTAQRPTAPHGRPSENLPAARLNDALEQLPLLAQNRSRFRSVRPRPSR